MIATSQDPVQSQPHSHTEYVNFEPSQHITINKLEDFHIVTAIKDYYKFIDYNYYYYIGKFINLL